MGTLGLSGAPPDPDQTPAAGLVEAPGAEADATLDGEAVAAPPPPVVLRQLKSPTKAFLLSLISPGIGHFYLRKMETAWRLVLTSAICLGLFVWSRGGEHQTLNGVMLVVLPALYAFGFVDAYYAAIEHNAGVTSYLIGRNPRVAALLNYAFRGFGYFYLGERTKGIVVFVGVGLLGAALSVAHFPLVTLLLFLLQFVLAADAYRIAAKGLAADFPELAEAAWKTAQGEKHPVLNPAVPLGLAGCLALMVATLVILGSWKLHQVDPTQVSYERGVGAEDAWHIRTEPHGPRFDLAPGFEVRENEKRNGSGMLFIAARAGECSVLVFRDISSGSLEAYAETFERQVDKGGKVSMTAKEAITLRGLEAIRIRTMTKSGVPQAGILTKQGASYYLVLISGGADCEDVTSLMEQTYELK
jgi:chromate transport protein ChrA